VGVQLSCSSPRNQQDVDPAFVLHDQVGDHSRGAEWQVADAGASVALRVHRPPHAPWRYLERGERLGETQQRVLRERGDRVLGD
jgi:hypothetical protein